jgi:hypothetical protein
MVQPWTFYVIRKISSCGLAFIVALSLNKMLFFGMRLFLGLFSRKFFRWKHLSNGQKRFLCNPDDFHNLSSMLYQSIMVDVLLSNCNSVQVTYYSFSKMVEIVVSGQVSSKEKYSLQRCLFLRDIRVVNQVCSQVVILNLIVIYDSFLSKDLSNWIS